MKERKELLNELYLNKRQISRLLGIGVDKAVCLYEEADKKDSEELEWRLEPNKVRTSTVLKLCGVSFESMKKRIEG